MIHDQGMRPLLEQAGPLQLFRVVPGEPGPDGELTTDLVGPIPMVLPDGTTSYNIPIAVDCRPSIPAGGTIALVVCSVRDGKREPFEHLAPMVAGDSFRLGGPRPGELDPDDPRVPGVRLELGARGLAVMFTGDDLSKLARAATEGPDLLAGRGGLDTWEMRRGGPWDRLVELLNYAAERAAAEKAGRYVDQPIPGRPPRLT